jgi:Domain of unknown function (DUF4337)
VRDLPCFQFRTTVVVELYRVRCPECGIKTGKVPQLPSKPRPRMLDGGLAREDAIADQAFAHVLIEEIVLQAKASDQWAYYRAKNIRRHEDEIVADVTSVQPTIDAAALGKVQEKYSGEASRYKDEQNEMRTKRGR